MKTHYIINLAALIAFLGTLGACKKENTTEPEHQPAAAAVPLPGSPDEVVLATDDIHLTMRDYDRCVDLHRLRGQVLTKRALANPRFQRDEVQLCIQGAYLKKYLRDNQVAVLPAERQTEIKKAMERLGVQSEQELAKKLEMSPEYLAEVVDEAVVPAAMQRALAGKLPEEAAKRLFMRDQRSYTVEIADFDNTPNDADIEDFLKNSQDKLNAYISSHPEVIMTPPKADLVRLAYAFSDEPDDDMRAYQKTEDLRMFAVRNGTDKTVEYCRSEAGHGCQVLNDKNNLLKVDRTDETAWAFRIPVGGVSEIKKADHAHEILILVDIHAPEAINVREGDNMKIVAGNAIRMFEPAAHQIAALKPALEAPDPDFKAVTEANGGTYARYENVKYIDLTEHNNLREARELLQVLAEVQPEHTALFSNPVLHNGRMYIFRINDMTDPTEEDFKAGFDAWKARKAADPSRELVVNWLNKNMPSMTSLNIKPIQAKYGILQPNGTIR